MGPARSGGGARGASFWPSRTPAVALDLLAASSGAHTWRRGVVRGGGRAESELWTSALVCSWRGVHRIVEPLPPPIVCCRRSCGARPSAPAGRPLRPSAPRCSKPIQLSNSAAIAADVRDRRATLTVRRRSGLTRAQGVASRPAPARHIFMGAPGPVATWTSLDAELARAETHRGSIRMHGRSVTTSARHVRLSASCDPCAQLAVAPSMVIVP